ncbi:MAG: biopolymer transporter ExbD [Pseudomonadota bacterium]
MPRRRRGRHEATVELTPLIDVVFLLLIFFMVSTTFVRESELKITLPEADGQIAEADRTVVVITVDNRGEYAVNDRLLVNSNKRTLVRALREVTEPLGVPLNELPVVIRADANATHQAVIRAMDAAGTIGLVQVSITTQQIDEDT